MTLNLMTPDAEGYLLSVKLKCCYAECRGAIYKHFFYIFLEILQIV
jgi:hypothetical protein